MVTHNLWIFLAGFVRRLPATSTAPAPAAFSVVRAVALRKQTPYRSTGLISGTLVAQLGVRACVSVRVESLCGRIAFVVLRLGLVAAFRGISDMTLAVSLWRLAAPKAAGRLGR